MERRSDPSFEAITAAVRDLTDESRLSIVGLLAQREHSVKELSELIGLKEPTVSHHLTKLSAHALVSMRRDGTTHLYRLNRPVLQAVRRELFSTRHVAALVDGVNRDAYARKVFRDYVEDGRIVRIPTTRKKRDVLVRWLAEELRQDVRYTEKEVNAIIRKRHPDVAYLRREMIGLRLLERERGGGAYWKPAASSPTRRT